ncbi:MAG: hypothetical protein ABI091_10325, partial [Ferruginibacter sp.]
IIYLNEIKKTNPDLSGLIAIYLEIIELIKNNGVDTGLEEIDKIILHDLINLINSPEAASNINYRKQLVEDAISIKTITPVNMANLQGILGVIYLKLPDGDYAKNIEVAIDNLKKSQLYFTEENDPLEFSKLNTNLGRAYLERNSGDKAENILKAIAYQRKAEKLLSITANPAAWASNQFNLGLAYVDNLLENIEDAIIAFNNTLKVYTQQNRPQEWALTNFYLGSLYYNRKEGRDADNLENCIKCYEKSLSVFTKEANAFYWMTVQNELGVAYSFSETGDKIKNTSKSLHYFKNAEPLFEAEGRVDTLEQLYYDIGDAYLHFRTGDFAENIEIAISYFRKGLQLRNREAPNTFVVITIDNEPEMQFYSKFKKSLGEAFISRLKGDRVHNLELSLKYLNDALFPFLILKPKDLSNIYSLLGIAYFERGLGDRSDNIEKSIDNHLSAIKSHEKKDVLWYMYHMELANAYRERIAGDQQENINSSIRNFEIVLEYITPANQPFEWSQCQHSLGNL